MISCDKRQQDCKDVRSGDFCFYNPMWDIMGKHRGIMGTYYCKSDQDDRSLIGIPLTRC